MEGKDCVLYIHSKCCDAHWELIYNITIKKYELVCEKCGKSSGNSIKIEGPSLSDRHCGCCGKSGDKK